MLIKKIIIRCKNSWIYLQLSDLRNRHRYRKRNTHNNTSLKQGLNEKCVHCGKYTYGEINSINSDGKTNLYIGNFVSIAPDVTFVVSGEHSVNHLSTFPFKNRIINGEFEALSKGDIIIGDDVWIGENAIILSGIKVGQGAVIAAGAVVTHGVPPYAIVAGVPAKIIRYRFKKGIIDFLLTLDYKRLNKRMIQKNIDKLYTPIDNISVDKIQKLFEWFPKKYKKDNHFDEVI